MVELTQLKVFLAVAEAGSFSRAADKLHLSQSAVSQNIQGLERLLGVQLFIRHGRSIHLSEAGQALLPLAHDSLNNARMIVDTMNTLQSQVVGELELGCSTTSGKYILPSLVAAFRREHPAVRVSIAVLSRQAVIDRLLDERLGLGVVSKQIENRQLEYQPFFDDRIVLIVPRAHSWADYGRALPADIPDQPLIVREPQAGTTEIMLAGLAQHNIRPEMLNVVMEIGNAEAIEMAVEEGIGIAFVSELVAARGLAHGRIRVVDVDGLDLRRSLFIARNVNATPTHAQVALWSFLQLNHAAIAEKLAAHALNRE
ncbi:MAG: LysR family transcriptional regulator [Chloroflexi bacterium]|nr:LysR family transcriptional regulator [Chloroflexota bacterium]